MATLCLIVFAVVWMFAGSGNCVIILDSGNPARSVRGSFLNFHQPEFLVGSTDKGKETGFLATQSVPVLMESISAHLSKFNEAMTNSLKTEVENTNAESALTTCQLAGSRLAANRVMNSFEAQLVRFSTASVAAEAPNTVMGVTESEMTENSLQFAKMVEYLQKYNPAVHGNECIQHFQEAMKDFHSLQIIMEMSNE